MYIHTIYGASMELSVFWDGFIKATKVHKCFWFGFPPRQPNIFGWVFLLRWIFYPIVLSHICRQCGTAGLGIIFRNVFEEWRCVRFGFSLFKLCVILVQSSKSGDLFVFRSHCWNCAQYLYLSHLERVHQKCVQNVEITLKNYVNESWLTI